MEVNFTPKPKPKTSKKPRVESTPTEESVVPVTSVISEPKPSPKPQKPKTDKVTVKVLVGTLSFEEGVFKQGETFETTKKRAAKFEPQDIQIV